MSMVNGEEPDQGNICTGLVFILEFDYASIPGIQT